MEVLLNNEKVEISDFSTKKNVIIFTFKGKKYKFRQIFSPCGQKRLEYKNKIYTVSQVNKGDMITRIFVDQKTSDIRPFLNKQEEKKGSLSSPMPGEITRILVKKGDKVNKGDKLIVIEAMKMEHSIKAVGPGTIKEIHCKEGEKVVQNKNLVTLEEESED